MNDRFLPASDPVADDVFSWTIKRDAEDIRTLLEWVGVANTARERAAILSRAQDLMNEIGEVLKLADDER